MVQLLAVLIGIGGKRENERTEGETTDEVELPEDRLQWDPRWIRWAETGRARRRGGRAANRQLADIPQPKIIVVHEGFDGLYSWKRQTLAGRQWAKHLRRTWGRGERRRTA